jgi:dipeptidyl-peptidase-4
VTVAALPLAGHLVVAGLVSGAARHLAVDGPVFDPRPDPGGHRLAYVRGRTLRVAELDGTSRELAGEDDPEVSWGLAEYVAAEEMDRSRGYWWAPDGSAVVAARADTSPVARWWISDPTRPDQPPNEVPYPAAGTANADVSLWVLPLDPTAERREVTWDRDAFPYLADVQWPEADRIVLTVQSRDQRRLQVLAADPVTGATDVIFANDDEAWVDLVAGAPTVLDDGRLAMTADLDGARRLLVSGIPVTKPDLQVRAILGAAGRRVLFSANRLEAPENIGVWRWSDGAGTEPVAVDPGVNVGWAGGDTTVVRTATLDGERSVTRALDGPELLNLAETALVRPNVTLLRTGGREVPTAVLLPEDIAEDDRLPVLLDPYGGPHAQRVVADRAAFNSSQWFADQGFAVVVADGRGTPGLGSAWERAVHGDLAGPVLDDQVDALLGAAAQHPQLDLSRVGIRGWSFGGYLAALAVLRRPDVFHAAVAGAPVTEWRLYDTHYTERYLGRPEEEPEAYDGSSLLTDAAKLERPLLIVHGLADDNVVVAHSLRLSSALVAAGRPHRFLPLAGVTHLTPQEVVAENLLLLQLAFLREALGLDDAG